SRSAASRRSARPPAGSTSAAPKASRSCASRRCGGRSSAVTPAGVEVVAVTTTSLPYGRGRLARDAGRGGDRAVRRLSRVDVHSAVVSRVGELVAGGRSGGDAAAPGVGAVGAHGRVAVDPDPPRDVGGRGDTDARAVADRGVG